MCADCKADLARVQHDLDEVTSERNQLLVIVSAAWHVVTPEQWAEMRRRIAARDPGAGSTV
jgi:hypothetical protein